LLRRHVLDVAVAVWVHDHRWNVIMGFSPPSESEACSVVGSKNLLAIMALYRFFRLF
jgi:hypothetical protein